MRRFEPIATALVRWRLAADGGRTSGPPPGPQYAASAVFVLGDDHEVTPDWPAGAEHFSVGMNLGAAESDGRQWAEIDFLARDLVADYVRPGIGFLVMEGPRPVADAEIISVLADGT